jgi:UPF0716 protein FxsA
MSGLGSPRPVTPAPRPLRRRLVGAAVLALPVLELAGIIAVGRVVGVFGTLLLLAAGVVVGAMVLRRVGAAAARRLVRRPGELPVLSEPSPPGTALLVPAGLLLMAPGFLSDVVGLVLLVPPVRRVIAARLGEAVVRRVNLRASGLVPGHVIPGEVIRGEVIPGEVIPGDVVSGEVVSGEVIPDRPTPGQMPAHPVEVHVTEIKPP